MELMLSEKTVFLIAFAKLFFYLAAAVGLYLGIKWNKAIFLVLLTSVMSGGWYFIASFGAKQTWWGLQGDEIFVTAALQKISSGLFFADFFHSNLTPFYPPLYFWVMGAIGYLFSLSGVALAHLGVVLTLLISPVVVYFWHRNFWKRHGQVGNEWQSAIVALSIFIVLDWTAIILKPYEFLSAVLISLWAVFLLLDAYYKQLNLKRILWYGIIGGLLFMLFYFWFLVIALAFAVFALITKGQLRHAYFSFVGVGLVSLIVALPYIGPLVASYLQYGVENWQHGFFITEYLDWYAPFLKFNVFGLWALFGLVAAVVWWERIYVKALASILLAAFLWQAINMVTIVLWQSPFLPVKPFLFLGSVVLSFLASYGLAEVLMNKKVSSHYIKIFIIGWLVYCTQLLGGVFIDNIVIRNQLENMRKPLAPEIQQVVDRLKSVKNISEMTILSSGIPQISAFVPLDYYVSYNVHFAHPASNFSARQSFVRQLSYSTDSSEFYQKLKSAPYGKIDALLLYKTDNGFPLFFMMDNYPNGIREEVVNFDQSLIDEAYFDTVFEDKYFVMYKVK
jgi:hypothetical protein